MARGLPSLLLLLVFGCGRSPLEPTETPAPPFDLLDPTLEAPIGGCELAPAAGPAADCTGPDEAGWSNQERPLDAAPCPPAPPDGCIVPILGRLKDTQHYINCEGYIVLNRTDWTIEMNDRFIACVAAGELGSCEAAAWVVSPRSDVPDFKEDFRETTVTSREMCQLHNLQCDVEFATSDEVGIVECEG